MPVRKPDSKCMYAPSSDICEQLKSENPELVWKSTEQFTAFTPKERKDQLFVSSVTNEVSYHLKPLIFLRGPGQPYKSKVPNRHILVQNKNILRLVTG